MQVAEKMKDSFKDKVVSLKNVGKRDRDSDRVFFFYFFFFSFSFPPLFLSNFYSSLLSLFLSHQGSRFSERGSVPSMNGGVNKLCFAIGTVVEEGSRVTYNSGPYFL